MHGRFFDDAVYADLMADPNALPLNVYQIWITSENERGGVWVARTTWPDVYVRITSVGEFKGAPPYFGYPKITADLYHADGRLKELGASLPAPGTPVERGAELESTSKIERRLLDELPLSAGRHFSDQVAIRR